MGISAVPHDIADMAAVEAYVTERTIVEIHQVVACAPELALTLEVPRAPENGGTDPAQAAP
jgi:hypothetical protein